MRPPVVSPFYIRTVDMSWALAFLQSQRCSSARTAIGVVTNGVLFDVLVHGAQ